jgi:hypothetical protein
MSFTWEESTARSGVYTYCVCIYIEKVFVCVCIYIMFVFRPFDEL